MGATNLAFLETRKERHAVKKRETCCQDTITDIKGRATGRLTRDKLQRTDAACTDETLTARNCRHQTHIACHRMLCTYAQPLRRAGSQQLPKYCSADPIYLQRPKTCCNHTSKSAMQCISNNLRRTRRGVCRGPRTELAKGSEQRWAVQE